MTVHLSTLQLEAEENGLLCCIVVRYQRVPHVVVLPAAMSMIRRAAFGSFFGLQECQDYRPICLRSTDSQLCRCRKNANRNEMFIHRILPARRPRISLRILSVTFDFFCLCRPVGDSLAESVHARLLPGAQLGTVAAR
jgi:hypothetical protein